MEAVTVQCCIFVSVKHLHAEADYSVTQPVKLSFQAPAVIRYSCPYNSLTGGGFIETFKEENESFMRRLKIILIFSKRLNFIAVHIVAYAAVAVAYRGCCSKCEQNSVSVNRRSRNVSVSFRRSLADPSTWDLLTN